MAPARPTSSKRSPGSRPGRGLRHATLEDVAFNEGDGSWAVSAEVEGALGLATLGTGIEPPTGDTAPSRKMPRRPRAGDRHRVRRSSACPLARAGDGRAVHRLRLRAAALSRPAGAGNRRAARHPRQRARPRAAFAQPPARKSAARTLIGSMRSNTKRPSLPSPSRPRAPMPSTGLREVLAARADPSGAFPSAGIAIEGVSGGHGAEPAGGRSRGSLSRAAAR